MAKTTKKVNKPSNEVKNNKKEKIEIKEDKNSKKQDEIQTSKKTENVKKENTNKKVSKGKKQEIQKSKKVQETSEKNNDTKKIIILVLIIIAVFAIFYIITLMVNKNNHDDIFKKDDLGNTEIQYDEIIVGTILKQSPNTYYVLVKDPDDTKLTTYTNIISEYSYYDYDYKIYTVDLGNILNKNSISEESSFETGNLKFKGTTLLKVEDKKISVVYESVDQIKEKLDQLLNDVKEEE